MCLGGATITGSLTSLRSTLATLCPGYTPFIISEGFGCCGDLPPRTMSLVSKQFLERPQNFLWEPENPAVRQRTARVFVLI